jgi:hypothetical protein
MEVTQMELDRQIELETTDNVVSLDEQRKLRQQRDAEQEQVEMIAEPRCEGGVCSLSWSPKKKTAAA